MFASGFFETMGTNALVGILVIWWLISKFLNSNPNVKDAAKQAAAKKAINVIKRWFE